MNTTQFRPDYFFYFLWSKGQNFFSNFGWPDYLFYLQKLPDPPRNQMIVPKINQEINEPSYEMVGVKITVTNYGQNNRIFGIFFLVDFLFSSLTTPNVFIVMVLKEVKFLAFLALQRNSFMYVLP